MTNPDMQTLEIFLISCSPTSRDRFELERKGPTFQ